MKREIAILIILIIIMIRVFFPRVKYGYGYMATGTGDFCVIPTSKSLDTPLITQRCYFEDEITNIITSKDMNE